MDYDGPRWQKLPPGEEPPTDFVWVYTDGACRGNPDGPAGWAWWNSEQYWAAGGFAGASNNVAELAAIIEVLQAFPSHVNLAIISDSDYATSAISVWATGWKRHGWTRHDQEPIKNLDLIQHGHELLLTRTGHTVIKRVRGHGKDPTMLPAHVHGNAAADAAAVAAKLRAAAGDLTVYGPGITGDGPIPPPPPQPAKPARKTRSVPVDALVLTDPKLIATITAAAEAAGVRPAALAASLLTATLAA